ncbi:cytochrome c family protein [Sphingomonas ginsenosidivorax]|uniref:Cytochrome c family protein n=1 Tax=Sphingomonas ginsenosidivorax TaxID=862135 RepID=A0A5C6UGI0_9SPHN|nr:cytochrome c family protein [Sphingomonas ginsenosidivorax]TXC71155.1 cytochrome c family protein [Sphingomonas ginsenosidivorax]
MTSASTTRYGRIALGVAASALALAGCSKKAPEDTAASETPAATPAVAASETAATPAAAPAAAAPAADNVDTISGVKFASFTGDAAKGKVAFITCQTCHSIDAGVNKIGPSLHAIVGRAAGSIAGFTYSTANKNSGITWTPEKLFQYLEKPQRVVPGTKMAFPGIPDPQKRADVIAYLKANG